MIENFQIEPLLRLAREAGDAVMAVYNDTDFSTVVDFKSDNSPLTLADKASHRVIAKSLSTLFPEIPVISEEGEQTDYEVRRHWEYFWLVDPLDGTKEFIKRNGEFTINIALIHKDHPVAGVVYTPVTDTMYYGIIGGEARKSERGEVTPLRINNSEIKRIAVRSKSHPSPEEEVVLDKFGAKDSISVGSSLKFCMVAEGKADIYYRHGPTMEWDTAAGQAVVEAAGGMVYLGQTTDQPFRYNKPSLLNGSFLCLG